MGVSSMIRPFLGSAIAASFLFSATTAEAQFFRFGPAGGVRIRVPFVSVDVGPGGATSVRAPFTAVDATGYPPVPPVPPFPPAFPVPPFGTAVTIGPGAAAIETYPLYPSAPEVSVPSDAQPGSVAAARPAGTDPAAVAEQLRASAIRLQASLTRRGDDADVWMKYLQPDQIIESIEGGQSPESLADLMPRYDGVVSNPSLGFIQGLDGFVATRQALRQWIEIGSAVDAADSPESPAPATSPKPAEPQDSNDAPETLRLPAPVPDPAADQPRRAVPPPPAPKPPVGAVPEPDLKTGSAPTRRSI
jgi:hypothetical protein